MGVNAAVAIRSRAQAISSGGMFSSSARRMRMAADEVATIATTMTAYALIGVEIGLERGV